MKGWPVLSACQEPKWYSRIAKFGQFPWAQYGRADTRKTSGRGPWKAGKELIMKESAFFVKWLRESFCKNDSILL